MLTFVYAYVNIDFVVDGGVIVTLYKAKLNQAYIVKEIDSNDEPMKEFLFSLGCYPGERVTIISKLASNFIISVKDARYSIDERLAKCILIEE